MRSLNLMVMGAPQVGKSALCVRFLTKRFIWEYHSSQTMLYNTKVLLYNQKTQIQVMDCTYSKKTNNYLATEKDLLWSDACIVVYSLTDASSYRHAWRIVQHIQRTIPNLPILILANKADLAPTMGCVDSKEALALAEACQCQFAEVSAAEGQEDVESAFSGVLMEARGNVLGRLGSRRRKLSFRTVSKALTAVFGRRNNTL